MSLYVIYNDIRHICHYMKLYFSYKKKFVYAKYLQCQLPGRHWLLAISIVTLSIYNLLPHLGSHVRNYNHSVPYILNNFCLHFIPFYLPGKSRSWPNQTLPEFKLRNKDTLGFYFSFVVLTPHLSQSLHQQSFHFGQFTIPSRIVPHPSAFKHLRLSVLHPSADRTSMAKQR